MVIYFKVNAFRQTLPDPHLKAAANILKTSILSKFSLRQFFLPLPAICTTKYGFVRFFYTFPYLIVKGMSAVEEELQGILDLYELDFPKYLWR